MTALCTLRASQSEAQQREWAAYHQVKQAVEMAEEANLEKTKVHLCQQSPALYTDDCVHCVYLKRINPKFYKQSKTLYQLLEIFFSGSNILSLLFFNNI